MNTPPNSHAGSDADPAVTAVACNDWLSQYGLRICDYATMAKGSWSIQRSIPDAPAYTEYWNDDANKWCSECTVYASELEAFGRAVLLAANARAVPPATDARAPVVLQRLARRVERRDRRIVGLERKIQRLETALVGRTLDLESLSRNVRRAVQDALCNVRMIPVFGGTRDQVITEVRNTPANANVGAPTHE